MQSRYRKNAVRAPVKTDDDYCTHKCPHRGICDKRVQRQSLEWCLGCKVKLPCILANNGIVTVKATCPHCLIENVFRFWKCLCYGSSPSGRLSFRCIDCGDMEFFFGSGKWKKV